MDDAFLEGCRANNKIYKDALDRITKKYSKFQHLGEEFSVDLRCIHPQKLQKQLKRIENTLWDTSLSKSRTDLEEVWNNSQDITSGSQLDTPLEDGKIYESVHLCHNAADASEMSVHQTQLPLSLLEYSQNGFPSDELQPEEQNEELQMSLSSNGSSLREIYPSMINRIEQAWQRQHVSLTANAVLKRYHRWRKKLNKSTLNNSFVVSNTSSTHKNLKEINKNTSLRNPSGPVIRRAAKESLLKAVTVIPCKQSPRKQCHPITVIDFSDFDISLNETITVSEQSLPDQNQSYIQEHDTKSPLRTKWRDFSFSPPSQNLLGTSKTPEISLNETITVSEQSLPDQNQSYIQEHDTKSPFRTKWRDFSFSPPSQNLLGTSKTPEISLNETITVSERSLPDQNQSYIQEHDTKSPLRTKWRYSSFSPPSQNLLGPSKTPEISLNKTITVSEQSLPDQDQSYIRDSLKTACPVLPVHLSAEASVSPMLKRLPPARRPMCISDSVRRSSPVRWSPLKVHLKNSLSQSLHKFNKTPVVDVMKHDTKSPLRTKWQFPSLSSSSQKLSESGRSNTPEISLNETFIVSEQSLPDQDQSYTLKTASPAHLAAKASINPMLKYKRLQSSSQSARYSTCTSDIPFARRGSPARQSPLKLMTSLSQSPMERDTKSPVRARWQCSSFSCPSQKHIEPSKIPTPNSQSFFSPQRPRGLSRRHLSFDSTQSSDRLSPQQVDSEYRRVFHKFVCLNKPASSQPHACSLCACNHSSSVLAALALSPHCFNQRKRYRGDELGTDPQSKRFRAKLSINSPGSKRLENENLRRCLYPAQPSCGTFAVFLQEDLVQF